MKMMIASAVAAVFALVGLLTIFGSFYTVDEGERAVVLEWGAAKKVTGPGLHWKTPFVESARKIGVRVTCMNWTGDQRMFAYSKDQQPTEISLKVCYNVKPTDDAVLRVYSEYKNRAGYSQAVIVPRALESTKAVFGTFNAVTAVQERTRLDKEIEARIKSIDGPVAITIVDVQNIDFSDAYENSVEERMMAQVEVERVQQNLERERLQAAIKVVQAEAEAARVKLAGDAEAAAIEARGQALRNNPELVALVAAEKWDGKLPVTQVPSSAVPFIRLPNGQ